MTGFGTKEDQEWWDNKENQFIFNFNLLWTSGYYWDRTLENVKLREEALRKLYRENCQHELFVMQLLAGKGINAVELRHLLNKVKKVKIKDNLKEILTTTFPDEYNDSDFIFFEIYAGKEANIYQWVGDWWILEDDNYVITTDCFEELSKQSA